MGHRVRELNEQDCKKQDPEPTKAEPLKSEPVKTEPAKTETEKTTDPSSKAKIVSLKGRQVDEDTLRRRRERFGLPADTSSTDDQAAKRRRREERFGSTKEDTRKKQPRQSPAPAMSKEQAELELKAAEDALRASIKQQAKKKHAASRPTTHRSTGGNMTWVRKEGRKDEENESTTYRPTYTKMIDTTALSASLPATP